MKNFIRLMTEGNRYGVPFGSAKPKRRHLHNFYDQLSGGNIDAFNQGQPWHPDNQGNVYADEPPAEDYDGLIL